MIPSKVCTRCKIEQPVSEFGINRGAKDGLSYYCKQCIAEHLHSRYYADLEKSRAGRRQERKAAYAREPEKYRQRSKDWQANNAEKIKAARKIHYQANKERLSRASVERARRNRQATLLRNARRRALRRNAEGTFTDEEWYALCEKYGNKCLRCGATGVLMTVDHVIPLSKGGSNWLSNLQPLCLSCNSSKHDDDTDYRP